MMGLALIGLIVMGSILGFGIYWLLTNITFKQTPKQYTYEGNKVKRQHNRKRKGN